MNSKGTGPRLVSWRVLRLASDAEIMRGSQGSRNPGASLTTPPSLCRDVHCMSCHHQSEPSSLPRCPAGGDLLVATGVRPAYPLSLKEVHTPTL